MPAVIQKYSGNQVNQFLVRIALSNLAKLVSTLIILINVYTCAMVSFTPSSKYPQCVSVTVAVHQSPVLGIEICWLLLIHSAVTSFAQYLFPLINYPNL